MSHKIKGDELDYNLINDTDTDTARETEREEAPVSAGTRSGTARGEGKQAPPGPACFKTEYRSRSRSSSAASERRSRRRKGFDANRGAQAASDSDRSGDGSTVVLTDDPDGDQDAEEEFFSPSGSRDPSAKGRTGEEESSLKRKAAETEPTEVTRRKQGRPPSTSEYVGLAKAQEDLNRELRETAELERENTLRRLSVGQIFTNMSRNVEEYAKKLENAPTADVASRNRDHMAEVARVAHTSKNLQGGFVKILKQAAACGMAATDVLRTRADIRGEENESETTRQLKAIRRELEATKREARAAREEAEALRKELAEEKQKAKRGVRRRAIIEDYPPNSPTGRRDRRGAPDFEEPEEPHVEEGPLPMEIENAPDAPATEEERVYDDAKRRKEILPPREQWPVAFRPPIQGKTMVLEDRPLEGHTVRLGTMPTAKCPPPTDTTEAGKTGAQMLFEQITPLLKKWLEDNLLSMGLAGRRAATESKAAKNDRQPNVGKRVEKPPRSRTREKPANRAATAAAERAAKEPKADKWSGVVGRKPPPPTLPTEQQRTSGELGKREPPNLPASGAWQVVTRKKAQKKAVPAKPGATEKRDKDGSAATYANGRPPKKGNPGNRRVTPPHPSGGHRRYP